MNEEQEQYKSIVFVDIDETICWTPDNRDYAKAVPMERHINVINALYRDGHKIVYWTARGTGTGLDWREVTEKQFAHWGVLYHELKFNKPEYSLFIDNKNVSAARFFDPRQNVSFGGQAVTNTETNNLGEENESNEIV